MGIFPKVNTRPRMPKLLPFLLALLLLLLVPNFGFALMMMLECMQLGWLLAKKRPRAFVSQKLFFFGLPLGLMTCRERSRAYAAE